MGGNFHRIALRAAAGTALAGLCLAAPLFAPNAFAQKVPAELMPDLPKVDTTPDADEKNRVVVGAMVPIPDIGEGAPLFTSSDIAQMQSQTQRLVMNARSDLRKCGSSPLPPQYDPGDASLTNLIAGEFEAGQRVVALAGKAEEATRRAESARRDAFAGSATQQEVEARELERQTAVTALQKARAALVEAQAMIGDAQKMHMSSRPFDWLELQMKSDARQRDDVGLGIGKPQDFAGLDITEVRAQQFKDTKGGEPFVRVSGRIVNTNDKSIRIPALSVALVDERGWIMGNQTVTPVSKKGIASNRSETFQIDVRPAPDLLQTALVTFAPKAQIQPRLGVGYFCNRAGIR